MTPQWVMLQDLLHLQSQARKAAPHVGVARRDPDPDAARYRDHRRLRTSRTRPNASASTFSSTLTRLPPPSSIVRGARTTHWCGYGRVLNRVGIQYWRVSATAAGIAVWAERRSMSASAPVGADGISGRPFRSTQWNRMGKSRPLSMPSLVSSGAQAEGFSWIAA